MRGVLQSPWGGGESFCDGLLARLQEWTGRHQGLHDDITPLVLDMTD